MQQKFVLLRATLGSGGKWKQLQLENAASRFSFQSGKYTGFTMMVSHRYNQLLSIILAINDLCN